MANICDNRVKIYPKETMDTFPEGLGKKIKKFFEDEDNDERYNVLMDMYHVDTDDEYYIEIEGSSKWNVRAEEWSKLAQKWQVNILITGVEEEIGFVQVVRAYADGQLENEELDTSM